MLFETTRLIVRQLDARDLDAMLAVYGDADAMRWVDDGQPITYAECVHWLEVTDRNYATRGYGMAAIELRATGEVIGFCGLVHPGGQPEAEIKYALRRAVWGQGIASEVARGMIDYGARTFDLAEIIATVAPENGASRRVLEKAGMRHVETRRDDDGGLTDVLLWRRAAPPSAAAAI
ncbi:MAG: GNAT family N-acetyltransferase [Caldilineaceae bacterium]|nr:GNAT family N-acetyltransferase [Caldilineaceae bacterium]